MPYSEKLAQRVRGIVRRQRGVTEKKMFGGLSFLIGGRMCCGILGDKLVIRVGADEYHDLLKKKHVSPMDFTGRPLKGFMYVLPGGTKSVAATKRWVDRSIHHVRDLRKK